MNVGINLPRSINHPDKSANGECRGQGGRGCWGPKEWQSPIAIQEAWTVSNSVEGMLASGTFRRDPSCVSEHRRYKVVGKQIWANQKHSRIDYHVAFQLFLTWEGLGVS